MACELSVNSIYKSKEEIPGFQAGSVGLGAFPHIMVQPGRPVGGLVRPSEGLSSSLGAT
jgi:hypothetical protein